MREERIVVFCSLLVGMAGGIISNHFALVENMQLALFLPFILYLIFLIPFLRVVRRKGLKWAFSSTFVTFFLIWIVTWFALYAM